jgi:hypothetical protein
MQIDIEDMLQELLRFDRKTNDKVKVDRLTRVVANAIRSMERDTPRDVLRTFLEMDAEGHA